MRYYQGDDINFSIDIKQVASNDVADWSNFPSVVVYLYTHKSYIAKFKVGKQAQGTGYEELKVSTDQKTISGRLAPEKTRLMQGPLRMSIRVKDASNDVSTKDFETKIRIEPTPIKHE